MNNVLRSAGRIAIASYLVALHVFAGFLAVRYFYPDFHPFATQPIAKVADPTTCDSAADADPCTFAICRGPAARNAGRPDCIAAGAAGSAVLIS